VLGVSLTEAPTVVRTFEVDCRAPIDPDRTVTVRLGPIGTGESRFTIEYEITDEGEGGHRPDGVGLPRRGRPGTAP
jgi:acyl-CoA thioesterase FadM